MKKAKRPWQMRGYAIGLAESVEMAISQGHQTPGMIAANIQGEWGTLYRPTNWQVMTTRTQLRKEGVLTFSQKEGWKLA